MNHTLVKQTRTCCGHESHAPNTVTRNTRCGYMPASTHAKLDAARPWWRLGSGVAAFLAAFPRGGQGRRHHRGVALLAPCNRSVSLRHGLVENEFVPRALGSLHTTLCQAHSLTIQPCLPQPILPKPSRQHQTCLPWPCLQLDCLRNGGGGGIATRDRASVTPVKHVCCPQKSSLDAPQPPEPPLRFLTALAEP